jgi:hypothetical protein
MASNFHNILGFLAVGVDVHKGIMPPLFTPALYAEVVAAHPFILGPNQKPKVKINGVNSVVDCHTPMLLWPHAPVFPQPPNILWPLDLIFGTQSCWLPRGTVQIEGTPATCAIAACVSTNLDCWEWAPIPSDLTLQFATVQTTPTLEDFLYGGLRALVNGALSAGMNFGFARLGKVKFKGSPLSRFTEKWTDKLGNALTKRGMGYKFARAVGKPFMSNFLQGASRQRVSGASWAAGRRIVNSALGRVLPGNVASAAKTGLGAFGWDPGKVAAQQIVGAPPGQTPTWNPFGGFKGASMLDTKVPLYGAVHGGVQAVGG